MLQEDNNPLHGICLKVNIPRQMKERAGIWFYKHPAMLPDLNPIEGVWNIFKQCLRKCYHEWKTYEEFKQIVLKEWDNIYNILDGTKSV
jgi:hypothetical protein